jgi:6,7-dimethyl-8-ribityllumazine synthase
LRFGIVVSRFNHLVSVRLLEACVACFEQRGAKGEDLHVAWVPGAFEIPQAARALAESGRQALARAGGTGGNKGEEAALAALEMAHLARRLREPPAEDDA